MKFYEANYGKQYDQYIDPNMLGDVIPENNKEEKLQRAYDKAPSFYTAFVLGFYYYNVKQYENALRWYCRAVVLANEETIHITSPVDIMWTAEKLLWLGDFTNSIKNMETIDFKSLGNDNFKK